MAQHEMEKVSCANFKYKVAEPRGGALSHLLIIVNYKAPPEVFRPGKNISKGDLKFKKGISKKIQE